MRSPLPARERGREDVQRDVLGPAVAERPPHVREPRVLGSFEKRLQRDLLVRQDGAGDLLRQLVVLAGPVDEGGHFGGAKSAGKAREILGLSSGAQDTRQWTALIVLHGPRSPPDSRSGRRVPRSRASRATRTRARCRPRTSRRSSVTRGSPAFLPTSRARVASLSLTAPAVHGRPVPSVPALREAADYGAPGAPALRTFSPVRHGPPARRRPGSPPRAARRSARAASLPDGRRRPRVLVRGRALDVRPPAQAPRRSDRGRRTPALAARPRRTRTRRSASAVSPRPCRRSRARSWRRTAAAPSEGGLPPAAAVLQGFLDLAVDAAARDVLRDVLPGRAAARGRRARGARGRAPRGNPGAARRRRRPLAPRRVEPARSSTRCPRGRCASASASCPARHRRRLVRARVRPRVHREGTRSRSRPRRSGHRRRRSVRRRGRVFSNLQDSLLARLGAAASLSPAVRRSLEERHPTGVDLSPDEAWTFLSEEAPLLGEAGVAVRLPGGGQPPRVALRLVARAPGGGRRRTRPSCASASTRSSTSTGSVAVGDALLSSARVRGARRPPDSARRDARRVGAPRPARTSRRRGGSSTAGPAAARRSASCCASRAASTRERDDVSVDGVGGEGWVGAPPRPRGRAQGDRARSPPPRGLTGVLRPYQMRGVAWLRFLLSRGLGACLADDMGLGKTIQFLATLLARARGGRAHRALAPRLPDVRRRELGAGGGALRAVSCASSSTTGAGRASGEAFRSLLEDVDLLVTTYALVHRDRALLSGRALGVPRARRGAERQEPGGRAVARRAAL